MRQWKLVTTLDTAMTPETRYTKSGEINIAYQVVGSGPRDLILVPGWVSNIEVFWEEPAVARFLGRLASFSRLILFDKRGTGLSDRLGELPNLETRMDDVRAVMDAVGSERAALCGYSDIRHILPAIRVPTLILHATGDLTTNVGASRYMAERIPEAKLVELPSTDHLPWAADADAIVDEIEEFVTGERHVREPDRILATILFTDIVSSTDRAAAMGDQRWRDLLQGFYGRVRGEFRQYRGIEVGTAGDGVLARFDGPARAIRCAQSVANAVHALGIEVRTGLHTGECELIGDNVGGIAVHTAARVAALARPAEVLVSHTVKDLVAGSGIRFEGRGTHTLKGVPGEWPLFAAVAQGAA